MSLVCRKWSDGYGSPSMRKTFRFSLTESQLLMDSCPVMKFVRKYSSMFRHIEIHYLMTFKEHLMYTWCRHLIVLLQMLSSNSQLISVKFQDLVYCFESIDTQTYDDIFRAISNFLGSQHNLKRAEIYKCFFGYQEGVKIFKNLTENRRESLTHLVLRKFVRYEAKDKEQKSTVA
ncbi:hypothetical protein AVEN_157049-1 [Araneus ventricosus]|uniref:Uncharacterized protein n=1 Tax=Araneus ventricosus TaxID=182803 RepID=A0A4Y2RQL4_ARAVE|nr:hypothetical protein AVEN_157049-1 [Araneus ventricosus]